MSQQVVLGRGSATSLLLRSHLMDVSDIVNSETLDGAAMSTLTELCSAVSDANKIDVVACVYVCCRAGPREKGPSVYGLDVTDVSRWEQTVLNPALQILDRLSRVRLLWPCLLLSSSILPQND